MIQNRAKSGAHRSVGGEQVLKCVIGGTTQRQALHGAVHKGGVGGFSKKRGCKGCKPHKSYVGETQRRG